MCFFRSARALSRHGPWTATSTFAPIEWSVIVPGAGVGRTKKPKVVRHPPTMWRGGTTISPGFGIRHRAVATCCSGIMSCRCLRDHLGGLGSPVGRSARYVDQIPTQYDHGEGSEGLWRVTFDAQQDFSSHGVTSARRRHAAPVEWCEFVRHGRELHGPVQGAYGVAGPSETVSGQCTWTPRRLPVRASPCIHLCGGVQSDDDVFRSRLFHPRIEG